MDEERVHHHEITMSKQTYLYYLQSCGCLELPDDDYTTEFEGEELINIESARFRRWLASIAKNLQGLHQILGKLMMLSFGNREEHSGKKFDAEKFPVFLKQLSDLQESINDYSYSQTEFATVFQMIADENSHFSRMSNLESTVLRLEKKIEKLVTDPP